MQAHHYVVPVRNVRLKIVETLDIYADSQDAAIRSALYDVTHRTGICECDLNVHYDEVSQLLY